MKSLMRMIFIFNIGFYISKVKKYEWKLPSDSVHHDGIVMEQTFNVAPDSLTIKFDSRY